jgi:hypothetical protein
MSEQTWEKWRFRTGVRWLWIEMQIKELLSRPKPINSRIIIT